MHKGSRFAELEWHQDGTVQSDHLLLQQFTGLYDKNGLEIYEGDILCPTCNLDNKPDLTVKIIVTIPDIYFDFTENEYYILGNIYENPELLNNGKD
jgi:uncharacterized phage protein (TIGR01671 family)